MSDTHPHTGLRQRLTHEMKQYAIVAAYLYVCLGALIFYKSSLLQAEGINYIPYGMAAIKALILGKFMLVGHAMSIGEGHDGRPLVYPILHKSVVFVALLFCLNMLEEIVAGLIHHRSVTLVVHEVTGGTLQQTLAVCMLFFLILLPYFAYREVGEALGEGTLRRLMFRGTDTGR